MNNEYGLFNRISGLDDYIRKNIVCMIPKVYCDIRIHLLDELYNLERNMFNATYNKGNIRLKYLNELRVNISLMDMLLNIKGDNDIYNSYMVIASKNFDRIEKRIYL